MDGSHLTHPPMVSTIFTQMQTLQRLQSTNTLPKSSHTKHHFGRSAASGGGKWKEHLHWNSPQGQLRVPYALGKSHSPYPYRLQMRCRW